MNQNFNPRITSRGTVFSGDDYSSRVACFPGLCQTHDDKILCSFRVGSAKDSVDETFKLMESSDEGATWNELPFAPSTAWNGVAGGFRIATIIETAPRELLFILNWVNHENPELPISHPETAGCLEMRLIAFRSRDSGQTWDDGEEIFSPIEQPEISGPLVALSENGHFLLPLENQKHYHDPKPINERAYCLISRDFGRTWSENATIAHDFPNRKFWGNRVAKLVSGELVCFSWTFDEKPQTDLSTHITFGSADGLAWGEPQPSGVMAQVNTPFPLDESTLLMAYNDRHNAPPSIRLRASFDGGKTWPDNDIPIYQHEADVPNQLKQAGGDLGEYYKAMSEFTFGWNPTVRLDENHLLTVYFAGVPDAIAIYWAHIALKN